MQGDTLVLLSLQKANVTRTQPLLSVCAEYYRVSTGRFLS